MIELVDAHNMGKVDKELEKYATSPNKENFLCFKLTKDEFKWYIEYLKKYENKIFLKDYRILHVGDSETNDFVLDYECENIPEVLDAHYIINKQFAQQEDKSFINTHVLLPHFIVYPLGSYFQDYESIVFSFEIKVKEEKTTKKK